MAKERLYALTQADRNKVAAAVAQVGEIYQRVMNLRVTGAAAFVNSPTGISVDIGGSDAHTGRMLGVVSDTQPAAGGFLVRVKRAYSDGLTVDAYEGAYAQEVDAVSLEAMQAVLAGTPYPTPAVGTPVMITRIPNASSSTPLYVLSPVPPELGVGDPWTKPKYEVDGLSGRVALQTEHLAPVLGSPREGVDDITLTPTVGGIVQYTEAVTGTAASVVVRPLRIDEMRHVVGVGDAVPIPLVLELLGDDPWIVVTEEPAGTWTITHQGPGEVTESVEFATVAIDAGVITWTGEIGDMDEWGHFIGLQVSPNTFTFGVLAASADWLEIAAGGGGGNPDATIAHKDPAAESYETAKVTDVEVVADGADWVLRVSFLPASVDAKGHVRDNTEATPETLDVPLVEVVIQEFQMSGNVQQVRTRSIWVPKAGTASSWSTFIDGTDCEE